MIMEKKKINNGLPDEIIESILLWLPVKSILRFRCVSKPWCSLIADPVFVDSHLKNLSKAKNHLNKYAIFIDPHKSLNSLDLETSHSRVIDDDPLETGFSGIQLWGSCNGLVCMSSMYNTVMCLWNPSTRKHKILPATLYGDRPNHNVHGFGYNATGKDYEVVKVRRVSYYGSNRGYEVTVYSLRRNSWRRIQDFPYGVTMGKVGVFNSGALHWKAKRSVKNGILSLESVIIAYDVGGESFREVPYPDHRICNSFDLSVATLDGNLCVVSYDEASFELWVMKEYGASESWFKQLIIRHELGQSCFLKPLCFINKGETLAVHNSQYLFFFELKSQSWMRWPLAPSHYGHDSTIDWSKFKKYCCEATNYTESLVAVE